MMVVMVMPVMTPMVMARLRLRGHWGQQKQEQGSEEKLFHALRISSGSGMRDNPPQRNICSGHNQ
jgi:hypothetical protein